MHILISCVCVHLMDTGANMTSEQREPGNTNDQTLSISLSLIIFRASDCLFAYMIMAGIPDGLGM